jgi:uncharacterized membrane protein YkoI
MPLKILLAILLTAVSLAAVPAYAEDDDHERVRAARKAGRVLPLARLLARVQAEQPGEVLEVELEHGHGHGRLIYEIKLLRPDGRLAELRYDAATGEPVTRDRR